MARIGPLPAKAAGNFVVITIDALFREALAHKSARRKKLDKRGAAHLPGVAVSELGRKERSSNYKNWGPLASTLLFNGLTSAVDIVDRSQTNTIKVESKKAC